MENTQNNKNILQKLHKLTIDFSVIKVDEVVDRLEEILKEVKKQKKETKGAKENDR